MDKFPDDFNRKTLLEKLVANQDKLIKQTRKEFHDLVLEQIEGSEKVIILEFPKKLWHENRFIVTNEILEKFGEIAVMTINGKYCLTRITNDKNDIPSSIVSIKLEF
jgi:hypothetical protein